MSKNIKKITENLNENIIGWHSTTAAIIIILLKRFGEMNKSTIHKLLNDNNVEISYKNTLANIDRLKQQNLINIKRIKEKNNESLVILNETNIKKEVEKLKKSVNPIINLFSN